MNRANMTLTMRTPTSGSPTAPSRAAHESAANGRRRAGDTELAADIDALPLGEVTQVFSRYSGDPL